MAGTRRSTAVCSTVCFCGTTDAAFSSRRAIPPKTAARKGERRHPRSPAPRMVWTPRSVLFPLGSASGLDALNIWEHIAFAEAERNRYRSGDSEKEAEEEACFEFHEELAAFENMTAAEVSRWEDEQHEQHEISSAPHEENDPEKPDPQK